MPIADVLPALPAMPAYVRDIAVPLGIGIAVFLFGLKAMEVGLNEWAGPFLTRFMRRFTVTPFRGLLTGTVATVLLQSSSAVTVITIGLVNAGVLSFRRTLGIVLGANIGACITADMLGLDLSGSALPLLLGAGASWLIAVALSPMLQTAAEKGEMRSLSGEQPHKERIFIRINKAMPSIRCLSLSISGFACILIGMEWMDSIVPSLQERGLFVWFVEQSQLSLVWGVIAGALITAVIQTSTATITIAMGLASVQAIPVELGIAIVLGANIGTCSTAVLACIGGSKAGRYVAYSHILLNLGGSMLFFPFIAQLTSLSALGSADPYEHLAQAQTMFNVICSVLALPFCYLRFNKTPPRTRLRL
ncbi:Na/Pi cotransporter family protein [Paenibacillus thermotolerans]|uniref:Na/Pi cotransporter family protein n=1 Tax=Paenibacillus thermotolerans TaxID=3027807 RepID=UPI00236844EE|nr:MULTISPECIES: Na/Pi symporter [unclassified Paenibacillus]